MATFNFAYQPHRWVLPVAMLLATATWLLIMWHPDTSWQWAVALIMEVIGNCLLIWRLRKQVAWYRARLETDFAKNLVEAMKAGSPHLLSLERKLPSDMLKEAMNEVQR